MTEWKPPPFGTPVWMAIPAKDVERSAKFYETVLKLPFKPEQKHEGVKLFDLSPGLNITGGILKAPDESGAFNAGRGGVCLYWMVDDLDVTSEAIEKAGGKMLSEKTKEGDHGMYRLFEDTEGTVGGVYVMV